MSQLSNAVFHVSFRLLQTKKHPDEPFDMRVSNYHKIMSNSCMNQQSLIHSTEDTVNITLNNPSQRNLPLPNLHIVITTSSSQPQFNPVEISQNFP